MKISSIVLFFCSVFMLSGCEKDIVRGEGSVITQERAVSNFTGVRSMGSANVSITQGNSFKVEVREYDNLLPYFETKLNGAVLELGFKDNINVKNSKAEVFITMPALQLLKTEGSGNISTTGIFPPAGNFDAQVTGSGNINIGNAAANRFDGAIRGSGNIKAFGMIAAEAFTQIEGSGNIEITATSKLNVKISGSGNVYYKSTPLVTTSISGSGQVVPH